MARPQTSELITIEYDGVERPAIVKPAKQAGNSMAVYVPKEWAGKQILCICLE